MSMIGKTRPNLMNHIGISSGEAQDMRVETRVLEPRTFSQSRSGGQVSFDLPKEGLLDQDIFLDIQLTNTAFAAAGALMGLPVMAGILGCLQTGSIYYNNILLQQTTELAQLLQLKMCFVEQDIRDQTYQVKIGSFSGIMVDTDSLTGAGATSVGKYSMNASNVGRGIVGLQEGVITATGVVNPDQYDKVPDYRIAGTTATQPTYSLPLKWVFPFLSQIQLPLGLLEGQVRIVFDFYPDFAGNRAIAYSAVPAAGAIPGPVNFNDNNVITESSVRLVVDLVYFDDVPGQVSPMERLAAEVMRGIELVYTDYTYIESVVAAAANPAPVANPIAVDTNTLCGLDHQVVRNLLIAIPNRATFVTNPAPPALPTTQVPQTFPSNPILGNFGSCASQGTTTLQIVINNQNVYPNAIDTDAKLFNEVSQVFNTPMKTNKGFTSWIGSTTTAALTANPPQEAFPRDKWFCGLGVGAAFGGGQSCLQGSTQYMGVNLSRTHDNVLGAGTAVGKSPLEIRLTLQQTAEVNRARRLMIWAECERVMILKGGQIMVSGS